LLTALKDGAVEVRKAAVTTLTAVEPFGHDWTAHVLPLTAEGEDREVRLTAVAILGGIEGGAREAIPVLQAIQAKEGAKPEDMADNDLISAIAQAVDGIREKLVATAAESLGKAKDPKARLAAAVELAEVAKAKGELVKPALPALLKAVKDDQLGVRRTAL